MTDEPGGWTYSAFRWRESDGDFETWVQSLADDGWERSEYGSGAAAKIDGKRTYVLTVRRWVERPWATPPS